MNTRDASSTVDNFMTLAREAMALVRDGRGREAWEQLRAQPPRLLSPAEVRPAARLATALAPALPDLPVLKVAFGGDVTLDDLVGVATWHALLEGLLLQPLVLPFGTWRQAMRHAGSELQQFAADVLWLFGDGRSLREDGSAGTSASAAVHALQEELLDACRAWRTNNTGQLVLSNLAPPAWRVLGNLEPRRPDSEASAVRAFNDKLVEKLPTGALLFDVEHLAAAYGLQAWHDERLYLHSKHPFAMAAHGLAGHAMARLLLALRGKSRKCMVLDLDNTLWGGVIGDDGPDGIAIGLNGGARGEAYRDFQRWLKALGSCGVLLSVCSKNDEVLARRAFADAPGMVLTLDDFAAFKANWRNKADNLREIAIELNLGLDAFVFVDDNPAERALVRRELPEVAVPELPEDPSGFVAAVAQGRWFEAVSVSDEDLARAQAYRNNRQREAARIESADLAAYLDSLKMGSRWGAVDTRTLHRAAQLVNKTNQFQLTGQRWTEAQLDALCVSPAHWVGWFDLSDSFGAHGITSIVVLDFDGKLASINTWVMSCRVFARSFEQFIFNRLVEVSRSRGASLLRGDYRPSAKNGVVRELYATLGGKPSGDAEGGTWLFALEGLAPAPTHIADLVD